MSKKLLTTFVFVFYILHSNAQLGIMKLVGKNTSHYTIGGGAFIKIGVPVSEGSDVTVEADVNYFFLNDAGTGDGTIMCPLKVGYRYTFNGTGEGFYVEPQVGYNIIGATSLTDDNGDQINLKYHGVVLAAGTGYLFTIWRVPFDLNFRYETVIAHGGSNNFISLGITKFFSFKKRDTGY